MTHQHQSALRGLITELLDGNEDLPRGEAMRRLLEASLQELIEAEVTAKIGAGRYERTEQRTTRRNGSRPKQLATGAGTLELAIPKLREGAFFPSLLEPRRRVDQALWSVIAQAWIGGVSTRRVDALVKALGNEAGISRSTVSRICGEIDEYVSVFLERRLDDAGIWYPYLWLDATYLDVRTGGRVVSQAVVVATGCGVNGHREVLGMAIGDAETTDFWTGFLRSLRERGLKVATAEDPLGVAVVVSDAHEGLKHAIKAIHPLRTAGPHWRSTEPHPRGEVPAWCSRRRQACIGGGEHSPRRRRIRAAGRGARRADPVLQPTRTAPCSECRASPIACAVGRRRCVGFRTGTRQGVVAGAGRGPVTRAVRVAPTVILETPSRAGPGPRRA